MKKRNKDCTKTICNSFLIQLQMCFLYDGQAAAHLPCYPLMSAHFRIQHRITHFTFKKCWQQIICFILHHSRTQIQLQLRAIEDDEEKKMEIISHAIDKQANYSDNEI
jgi:hypothetical protein